MYKPLHIQIPCSDPKPVSTCTVQVTNAMIRIRPAHTSRSELWLLACQSYNNSRLLPFPSHQADGRDIGL